MTALASVVIALCALGLTLTDSIENRRHNRLSVKPFVSLYSDFDPVHDDAGLVLRNVGLGPAIITDFQLFCDGREYKQRPGGPSFADFSNVHDIPWKLSLFPQGSSLANGDGQVILGMKANDLTDDRKNKFLAVLDRIQVKITYSSMYDESWTGERSWRGNTRVGDGSMTHNYHLNTQ